MLTGTLRIAYEDPKIIGFNMFHLLERNITDLDPTKYETGMRCYAGLINATGTPKQAYNSVKEYWNSLPINDLSLLKERKGDIKFVGIILGENRGFLKIIIYLGIYNFFGINLCYIREFITQLLSGNFNSFKVTLFYLN
ncbi:MAG: hypothetical protein ACTSRG_00130 [Candidatus Helarchaeota archaeon]